MLGLGFAWTLRLPGADRGVVGATHGGRPPTARRRRRRCRACPPPRACTAPPSQDAGGAAKNALRTRTVATSPIAGQRTGTSGLRKRTEEVVNTPHFVANWAQSLFDALGGRLRGRTLVVGGDGRAYNATAVQLLLRMAAANGVARVIVGQHALLSTPAVSAAIRERAAGGGLILTASHNAGGADGDWGIKYNVESGAPATEELLDEVYRRTQTLTSYRVARLYDGDGDSEHEPSVPLHALGAFEYAGGAFCVEVVDPTLDHLNVLRRVFDFGALRAFVRRADFALRFDAMHAAAGPSARRLLVDELGAPEDSLIHAAPREDFGGRPPDPNPVHAAELYALMMDGGAAPSIELGVASDGDGDRNMVLGRGVFVTPSDSLAVIVHYAQDVIPFFARGGGLRGVARSMPTASAVDVVAARLGVECFETPTGWKFFGGLMDAGRLSICGEESFGTGSEHIREKDGLWALLAWLSILAHRNRGRARGELLGVKHIMLEHWRSYGRHYYSRYDYERVEAASAEEVMEHLRALIRGERALPEPERGLRVQRVDEFSYTDCTDGSTAARQGIRVFLEGRRRIVVRLSGTGASGATVRIYLEAYETDEHRLQLPTPEVIAPLAAAAVSITHVQRICGRSAPSVIV